ncbi:cobalt transporter CbiM [Castellaniella sp.]|uniref:cobalt transporter CbiM n=1 Tax=Castellaniella sp. TaxID=1955812 RepID=UPI00355E8FAC
MAHIPDGILSVPVLVGGGVVAAAGVALAIRRIDDRSIPRMAILSAVFFVASLISVPIGPSSVHLLLSGLMGLILGVGIFPAVVVALVLQAVLFGFGGLTTLGINATNIALPGAIVGLLLGPWVRHARSPFRAGLLAAVGAALCVLATGGLVALALWLSSSEFTPVAKVVLITYVPLALADAVITAAIIGFLARVRPQALLPHLASPDR